MSDPKLELQALRARMDEVNERLVDALCEFYAIAESIGEVKDRLGMPHQDLAREAEMRTRVLLRNRGPLTAAALTELFNHVLRLSVLHMDEGGKSRLSIGRGDHDADRVVAIAALALGDGPPVLGRDGPDGLSLGTPGGGPTARVRDAAGARGAADAADAADAIRIPGPRMYDYRLLAAAGAGSVPVILERNAGATVAEWLHAAEYVAAGGNGAIALCERGSLSFGGEARPVLDLSAVALARASSVLPVLVHLGGVRDAGDRRALAGAALAAGACGIVVAVEELGEGELAALEATISAPRWAGSPGP